MQVPQGLFSFLSAEGLSGCVLPLHDHRHRTYVTFIAVLSMDVLQHCVSGQRSGVSNVSVKVLNALCVSASKTDEGRTLMVSTDAIHNSQRVQNVSRCQCDQRHLFGERCPSVGVVPMPSAPLINDV